MKYLVPFAACLLQSAFADYYQRTQLDLDQYDYRGLGPPADRITNTERVPSIDTQAIEDRVKAEMTMMINGFSFDNAVDGQKTETEAQVEWGPFLTSGDKLRSALSQISSLLKDRDVIAQLWPEAQYDDMELYSHLNLKVDYHDSKVEIFTAATTPDGTPLRMKALDISGELVATSLPRPTPPPTPTSTSTNQ